MNTLVIDTNILIAALIKDGLIREIITELSLPLLLPEAEFLEIKNNLNEILEKSGLSHEEFRGLFSNLLKYIKIIENDKIADYNEKAEGIIGRIHFSDVPFIAAALATDSIIWSDDKHFKKQNKIKVLTTKDITKSLG